MSFGAIVNLILYGETAVREHDVRMNVMSTTTGQEAASQSRLPARDRQVIGILLVAAFVVILNETIMSVAPRAAGYKPFVPGAGSLWPAGRLAGAWRSSHRWKACRGSGVPPGAATNGPA
jgi:hypothetical protein